MVKRGVFLIFLGLHSKPPFMNRNQLLDLYYLDARARVIDLAAFFDRIDRAEGEADFRLASLKQALALVEGEEGERARKVLMSLSDPTVEPVAKASVKGAVGAYSRAH